MSEQRCHFMSKVAADTKTQTVTSQSPRTCISLYNCMWFTCCFNVKQVAK